MSFALYDQSTREFVRALKSFDVCDYNPLYTIVYTPITEHNVWVEFFINDKMVRIEKEYPYCISGNSPNKLHKWTDMIQNCMMSIRVQEVVAGEVVHVAKLKVTFMDYGECCIIL